MSSALVPVPVNFSGNPGGLFAAQEDCESSRVDVTCCYLGHHWFWAWHHEVFGTSDVLHWGRGQSQTTRNVKEQSTIACVSMGKGTNKTDRVPISIPSGIYSKPPNRREQEPSPPLYRHINFCAHCMDGESTGDTTNGQKNAQPP